MSRFLSLCVVSLVLAVSVVGDADAAKRLGGGRAVGMQRESISKPASPTHAPAQQQAVPHAAPAVSPPPAQSGWRKWAGPLAGLAAGIGLAALMSHLGLGAEFGNLLLMLGVGALVAFVIARVMASKQKPREDAQVAMATEGAVHQYRAEPEPVVGSSIPQPMAATGQGVANNGFGGAANAAPNIPAGFDVDGFVAQAKMHFIRLQKANDTGNLTDLREFVMPELFEIFARDIDARRGEAQQVEVLQLTADVLTVHSDITKHVATLRFSGLIRESISGPAEAFREVWILVKAVDGRDGWRVAGIEPENV